MTVAPSDQRPLTQRLQALLDEVAAETGCPGSAVGLWLDGECIVAVNGVTSLDNPLPVTEDTLFQIGSTTKTLTATALMRLVEQGAVDLDARVRDYLPDFRVRDETASESVTVRDLTNHTAGWAGDYLGEAGDYGNGALRRYVEKMADLPQEFPVGTATSYNNASFTLIGRIIEVVTGQTYEGALHDLVLAPLGMDRSFLLPADVMTHRFTVGHNPTPDGFQVARPWSIPRGSNAAGGIASSVRDQLTWLDVQLRADRPDLLADATWAAMWEPASRMPAGNAGADAVGIAWMLKDLPGGLVKDAHGGGTIGQVSSLEMVPDKGIGVTVLTNAASELSRVVARRVLAEFGGVTWEDPQPTARPIASLLPYVGVYDGSGYAVELTVGDDGLLLRNVMQPELLAQLGITEPPPAPPPMPAAMVGETGDVFVITAGPAQGATGGFARDADGRIIHLNLSGRLAFLRATPETVTSPFRKEQS